MSFVCTWLRAEKQLFDPVAFEVRVLLLHIVRVMGLWATGAQFVCWLRCGGCSPLCYDRPPRRGVEINAGILVDDKVFDRLHANTDCYIRYPQFVVRLC